jgi:uncharacterized membrane protein YwzB
MKLSTIRLILIMPLSLCIAGCSAISGHSPTIDVLGSYFPAWMVCIIAGLIFTSITYLALVAIGFHTYLRPAPIVYSCLMLVFTMAVWLAFYRN